MMFLHLIGIFFVVVAIVGCDNNFKQISNGNSIDFSGWLTTKLDRLYGNLSDEDKPLYKPTFVKRVGETRAQYIIGIHPLHNPKKLFEVYDPIIKKINRQMPQYRFKLEASRNYEEFEKKLYSGHFDFAMPNPMQSLKSLQYGYRIFGKMADDEVFRGIVLIRKDSNIHELSDLKGKVVAYPAKTALAATLMPQYYFHTHGLDVNHDIENRFVGSQESAIMNVVFGHVSAAATWPVPWHTFSDKNPELANQLEIKWQTESLPNNGWIVRRNITEKMQAQFSKALFSLQDDQEGRNLLAAVPVSRFERADENTYLPVKDFIKRYSEVVRSLD